MSEKPSTDSRDAGAPAPFDAILAPLSQRESVLVPPSWGQGRATFGGLVAAMMVRRARAVASGEGPEKAARSFAFALVAPLAHGEALVTARVLRAGKSATQVEARITQNGAVAATMIASYGAPRASHIALAPAAVPAYPAPDGLAALPYVPGLVPEFTQHVDLRWAEGAPPFSGRADARSIGGWVRFRAPTAEPSVEHLVALADAWPPTVLSRLSAPAPASTLSWSMDLTGAPVAEPGAEAALAFLGYRAETELAADGYAITTSRVWRADGTLLAMSRQTVAVFA